jgi:hypothetical protein
MLTRVIVDARQPHMDPEGRFRYGLERVQDSIQAALPAVPEPDGDDGG